MNDAKTEHAIAELLVKLGAIMAPLKGKVRTPEVRYFIRKHRHVGDFKSLAITLILLAEGDVAYGRS